MKAEKLFDLLESLRKKCRENEAEIRHALGLSETEYRGLLNLERYTKIPCREFARRMKLSPSRGSRVIDILYSQGYIHREEIAANRRSKNLWLTKKGHDIQRRILLRIEECEKKISSGWSDPKLENLKDDIRILLEKWETPD